MVPPTAGLASVHTLGCGTSLLKRGRTLFHSGVAAGKSCQFGVGILIPLSMVSADWGFPQ